MFKNYVKVALRNLWKRKLYSFINITGLAIGIAACLLILLMYRISLPMIPSTKNQIAFIELQEK